MVCLAEKPFEGYTLYKVFHKGQGRFYAQLVNRESKHRTTISYARYIMSVYLGRLLDRSEQVDHINGVKTDDIISNLQILTVAQNNIKYTTTDKPTEFIEHVCPECNKLFTKSKNRSYQYLKFGKRQYCSKECSSAAVSRRMLNKSNKCFTNKLSSDKILAIRNLRSSGMTGASISAELGISRNTVMKYW